MHNRLISVVGPTAVGKTSFTLKYIEAFQKKYPDKYQGFDIISADSRQVYKDLEIISGADIPQEFVQDGNVFKNKSITLHGLLMLEYQQEWSLAHFKAFAEKTILASWQAGRLPIVVGGTGLYHEHLFKQSNTVGIKPNEELRKQFADYSVEQLQGYLLTLNEEKYQSLNQSDRQNPVRLLRAIEIEVFLKNTNSTNHAPTSSYPDYEHIVIGLKSDLESIEKSIKIRVKERFEHGAQQEVEALTAKIETYGKNKQVISATGVKEIQAYLDGVLEKETCLEKWTLREFQYAKRQITWWKHKKTVTWVDINEKAWKETAFEVINKFVLPVHF